LRCGLIYTNSPQPDSTLVLPWHAMPLAFLIVPSYCSHRTAYATYLAKPRSEPSHYRYNSPSRYQKPHTRQRVYSPHASHILPTIDQVHDACPLYATQPDTPPNSLTLITLASPASQPRCSCTHCASPKHRVACPPRRRPCKDTRCAYAVVNF